MEPVYNGTIFNSTVKVQLYGFFSFLNCSKNKKKTDVSVQENKEDQVRKLMNNAKNSIPD